MSGKTKASHSLGATARWTAAVRARETQRDDRLFNDLWAGALAGREGEAWVERWSAGDVLPIVLRTRFFDDFLLRTTADRAIRQIVLMAAGLDTRAFRLNWPEKTRLFELDRPEVLNHKERILRSARAEPSCERKILKIDLTGPWMPTLIDTGFHPLQPSAWLLEGFLYYLSNQSLSRLLDEITCLAAPGSWIGFDIINSAVLTSPWTLPWVQMQERCGAPWIGSVDEPEELLATRGWKAAMTQAGQPDAHHGRWPYPVFPTHMPFMPHHWFVVGCKQAPMPS